MESNRSKLIIPLVILLGFILLTGGIIWGLNMFSFRVAIVDLAKITNESGLSKRLNQEIQQKGQELQVKANQAKTDAEKKKVDEEFQTYKTEKSNEFSGTVKDVIAKVAKKKGIKAVTRPEVYIYATEDITTQVMDELK